MVRQAGLWQTAAGQRAQQWATRQVVRDIGARIASDHAVLDEDVRTLAERIDVELPDRANEDQAAWTAELATKSGPGFDPVFVNRARAELGAMTTFVAQVRAETQNTVVRAFARYTGDVLDRHMTLLEDTGLVNFNALQTEERTVREGSAEPVLGPATSTEPAEPLPAPATSITQGASIPVASTSRTDGGNGVDLGLVVVICVAEIGLTVGLLRLLKR